MKNYLLGYAGVIYNNALQNTKLYQGTANLLTDAKTALMAITTITVIVLILIQLVLYMKAGDEDGEKQKRKKNAQGIAIAGVVILCVEGLVSVLFSYFL